MKKIPITPNKFAIVDDDDFEKLSRYKWHFTPGGYAVGSTSKKKEGKRRRMYMHREISKPTQGMDVDHINGNGLDNRKTNLRNCTHSQNMMNRKKNSGNISGYKGVVRSSKNTWQARIRVQGKLKYIGSFSSAEDAARAYDKEALILFGNFAKTNFTS